MSLSFSCHDVMMMYENYYRYGIACIIANTDRPSPGHNSTLLNTAMGDAQNTDKTRV